MMYARWALVSWYATMYGMYTLLSILMPWTWLRMLVSFISVCLCSSIQNWAYFTWKVGKREIHHTSEPLHVDFSLIGFIRTLTPCWKSWFYFLLKLPFPFVIEKKILVLFSVKIALPFLQLVEEVKGKLTNYLTENPTPA